MFDLIIEKELAISGADEDGILDALRRFAFLTGYKACDFIGTKKQLKLTAGSVMSLNPNGVKHTIRVDYSDISSGRILISASLKAFPWERSKMNDILTHRLAQLTGHLFAKGVMTGGGANDADKAAVIAKAPFTHLPSKSAFHYITSFLKVILSMFLSITGVILTMWIYGMLIIGIKDSRLFFEVTFGTVSTADLVGGSSVIGIAIGYAIGMILSVYFALSEVSCFLNKRILSFGIFYALILSFFIIEEEAFFVTSLLALFVPFCAYTFYRLAWGLKKVYLKDTM